MSETPEQFVERIKSIIMSGDGSAHFEVLAHRDWGKPNDEWISFIFRDGVESGRAAKSEFN